METGKAQQRFPQQAKRYEALVLNNNTLRPYQKNNLLKFPEKKHILLADEMGLGKTIQVLFYLKIISETNKKEFKTLVITPASLKLNWEKETKKWTGFNVNVLSGKNTTIDAKAINIVNYDIVSKIPELQKTKWDIIICDEAHYLKNAKAKRTRHTLRLETRKWMFLTGTPILNRPAEIFTLLKKAEVISGNWFEFHSRFCDLKRTRWGLDYSGASNLDELKKLLSGFVIRNKKSEVLKELPAKIRQIIPIKSVRKTEIKSETKEAIDIIYSDTVKKGKSIAFQLIALERRALSKKKETVAKKYIQDLLSTEKKIVVFAHHKSLIRSVYDYFRNIAVKSDGDMSLQDRYRSVELFQSDDTVRLFVGSIGTSAEGINLTTAKLALFLEIDWKPSILLQCEDRLHRFGQNDAVNIQYLLFDNSLETYMLSKIFEKQKIINNLF
jgi:SWI/SNF-related matrix-associated actin-dependent regulator 1 of chromatin subfamily A